MVGDNKYKLLWRLVETAGGTPLPGDLETDLLEKYLRAIGGTPTPGDDFNVLLRKIVIIKGGTPRPGDNEWNLLVKWLQAEGECRACGDSVYDLWRKILATSSGSGSTTPFNLVASNVGGNMHFEWEASADPASWAVQLIDCALIGPPVIDTSLGGTERSGDFLLVPAGSWVVRIRDFEAPPDEWVVSNCVDFFLSPPVLENIGASQVSLSNVHIADGADDAEVQFSANGVSGWAADGFPVLSSDPLFYSVVNGNNFIRFRCRDGGVPVTDWSNVEFADA
jgi:hypothetical protein